jgi:hypothetical protein
MSPEENPKVAEAMQIMHDYFESEGQSEEEIQASIGNIAAMVQEPGAKLVQFGTVIFLVLVRGEGVIEFHTMGLELNPRNLVKRYVELTNYLKSIGTKIAYSYASDPQFKRIAKMTGLPWKTFDIDVEGEPMTAYVLEM